ncbi:MAG: hypothetical protein WBM50_17630 [Acidimicrobiales bacterium]
MPSIAGSLLVEYAPESPTSGHLRYIDGSGRVIRTTCHLGHRHDLLLKNIAQTLDNLKAAAEAQPSV